MELTVQTLREVVFGQKRSGYDPADVDDFIDQVAEGVEDLHRKLREANERAAAAPTSAAPAAMSASDIGKVWERAAAAAEQAVEEARQEASRILEEARSNAAAAEAAVEDARQEATRLREDARNAARQESDQTLNAARNEAEGIRSSARSEADSLVTNARNEASRFAEESQGQLRADISQLEEARNSLRGQAEALGGYIEEEVSKVRAALSQALSNLDTEDGQSNLPETHDVSIPPQRFAEDAPAAFAPSPPVSYTPEPAYVEPLSDTQPFDEEPEVAPWESTPVVAAQEDLAPWERPETTDGGWQSEQPAAQNNDDDSDVDPFLAELRRAVHDESPLGPRGEDSESDDTSINGLYSDDEDDKGFFRRKR